MTWSLLSAMTGFRNGVSEKQLVVIVGDAESWFVQSTLVATIGDAESWFVQSTLVATFGDAEIGWCYARMSQVVTFDDGWCCARKAASA